MKQVKKQKPTQPTNQTKQNQKNQPKNRTLKKAEGDRETEIQMPSCVSDMNIKVIFQAVSKVKL